MKKLGVKGQRFLKFMHLIFSSMWLGGALGLVGFTAFWNPQDFGETMQTVDLARKYLDDYLVIPGALGCLLSGFLISLFTSWGFFKHRWLTLKWILTVSAILFGTFILGPLVNGRVSLSSSLGLKALEDPFYISSRLKSLYFGLGQISVIIFMIYISVMKPWRKKK